MMKNTSIVDADVRTLSNALASGSLTSVDLVAKYLLRIAKYDCRTTALNSVPLLNEDVFNEAAAADDRRMAQASRGVLDGLPFTVKDSYKVKGMTVASGSEAFEHLIANEDAFAVTALRNAGAMCLGLTNMCPMAYGGMIRGVYGRAESPYNPQYLAAAFGSGSSNGSGVSVASSFAAFGMGGETVSSGRSPASNNALVAYTPSRGLISLRGTWPLYPTCDVAISHTRTVNDLFALLDTLSLEDHDTVGDFWRDQPFLSLPKAWPDQLNLFESTGDVDFLKGKRIIAPLMYLEQMDGGPYVSSSIRKLWDQAKSDLEAAGAIVEEKASFPIISLYEEALSKVGNDTARKLGMPDDWNTTERGMLIAHAWQDFLQSNRSETISSLTDVDPTKLFPHMSRDNPQLKFTEPANMIQWSKLADYVKDRDSSIGPGKSPIYNVPGLKAAVMALEAMRKEFFEQWMDKHKIDFVVFPAAGDVGCADADINEDSAKHAWENGIKYSHGNRALRHLGIPSVTVPMGILSPQNMPMGLTFLGHAYDDTQILKAAFAYEQASRRRIPPPLTPALPSDAISEPQTRDKPRPDLSIAVSVTEEGEDNLSISLKGIISANEKAAEGSGGLAAHLEIFIDGVLVPQSDIHLSEASQNSLKVATCDFTCKCTVARPPKMDQRNRVVGKVARDSTMIMVLAKDGENGWPAGWLKIVHQTQLLA